MEDRLMRIEELALVLGVNQFTIERWYRFKRENPDNEYVQLLPSFEYATNSKNAKVRYWKASDIGKLKEFQNSIIAGTKGFMGSVTNLKKRREQENGKKKIRRSKKQRGSRKGK